MEPKEVVEKWIELFNKGEIDALTELYHENAVNHQVANEPVEGRNNIGKMFEEEFAHADMTYIPENIYQDGEWAILEWKDPLGLLFIFIVSSPPLVGLGLWSALR